MSSIMNQQFMIDIYYRYFMIDIVVINGILYYERYYKPIVYDRYLF